MAEEITVAIAMERFRCNQCRRYFLVEIGSPHPCPACSSNRIEELRLKVQAVQFERDEAAVAHGRQVSALRGAITRAKNG